MVSLDSVSKIYHRTDGDVTALSSICLHVEQGEFVAVTGPSGSGKSTLMNILGCLDRPTSGNYLLNGLSVSQASPGKLAALRNRQIGFIFQDFRLLDQMSALENVALPLSFCGIRRTERLERAARLLDQLGMGDRLQHHPSELSGGQRQRVAVARALVTRPRLLLADEPTGNLDPRSGSELLELLGHLNRKGVTLLLITHDMRAAAAAKRRLRLYNGRLYE